MASQTKLKKESALNNQMLDTITDTMERLGINNCSLARMIGTSRVYVSQVVNGHRTPTVEWLQKVCDELGLELRLEPKPARPKRRKAG
jgi:antitoxin component HigA of HigAB toxin-antitoxin module